MRVRGADDHWIRGNGEDADSTKEGGRGEGTGDLALIPHGYPKWLLASGSTGSRGLAPSVCNPSLGAPSLSFLSLCKS